MYLISIVTISILLLNIVQIESYTCSCSCCFGQGCQAALLPSLVDAQQCTDASCLEACKARYYQCNVSPPNGQAIGRCLTTTTSTTTRSPEIGGAYTCVCNCCNTGSYTCTPVFIGYTNAHSCQVGACSIACTKQYPSVCVNNQFGQTQGICTAVGTSTATIPSGSSRCGCSCCGSSGCHNYEVTTTNGCSSCYTACQSIQLQCYTFQTTYCNS
jgi:hypothetical protein